ncbi:MAG TPA: 30S ribosomal protein S20 [Candidatus Limnocylindrales bacterium]|nr:30S ribosomal protein S20 [Candidatus Limnocylindrales bacterium]
MARAPRKWKGARTPSGLKRVRSSERRAVILGPRRSTAKTAVRTAIAVATSPGAGEDPQASLVEALSALDRAAKVGAIHPNAAARRKSRLTRHVNELAGGVTVAGGRAKQVSRTQAQKAAKARIAAGKAGKAKGAQTAAGKARAALTRTSRSEAPEAAAKAAPVAAVKPGAKAAAKAAAKPAAKKAAPKAKASKPAAKATKPAAKKAAKS